MRKLERSMKVVAAEVHPDLIRGEVQVIAESPFEAVTFICRVTDMPVLGSHITITIEDG